MSSFLCRGNWLRRLCFKMLIFVMMILVRFFIIFNLESLRGLLLICSSIWYRGKILWTAIFKFVFFRLIIFIINWWYNFSFRVWLWLYWWFTWWKRFNIRWICHIIWRNGLMLIFHDRRLIIWAIFGWFLHIVIACSRVCRSTSVVMIGLLLLIWWGLLMLTISIICITMIVICSTTCSRRSFLRIRPATIRTYTWINCMLCVGSFCRIKFLAIEIRDNNIIFILLITSWVMRVFGIMIMIMALISLWAFLLT